MKTTLILASESPRRFDLLRHLNFDVHVLPAHIDERIDPQVSPLQAAKDIALAKGKACLAKYADDELLNRVPVLSADTIVVIEGEVLGKPKDKSHAKELLQKLSGKTHLVITAYSIIKGGLETNPVLRAVQSEVSMAHISEAAMDWYLSKEEPYDKAGAYAIQGMGAIFIKSIAGSYTNVMGLPLCEVVNDLISMFGMDLP